MGASVPPEQGLAHCDDSPFLPSSLTRFTARQTGSFASRHIWLLVSFEDSQPILQLQVLRLGRNLPLGTRSHPSFLFSRGFAYFDSGGRQCLPLHCRWGLRLFKLLCLREDPISLPFIFPDAAQPAYLLPYLLQLAAELLQEGTPPAGQRAIFPGLWERSQVLPAAGTWMAASAIWSSVCAEGSALAETAAPTSTGETALLPPCLRLLQQHYFSQGPLTSLLLHTLLHKLLGLWAALWAWLLGPFQAPVKGCLTFPNQRELHQMLQAPWVKGSWSCSLEAARASSGLHPCVSPYLVFAWQRGFANIYYGGYMFPASLPNAWPWAAIAGNQTQVGSIPLGSCQGQSGITPGDPSALRLRGMQPADSPGEKKLQEKRCVSLFQGKEKDCSTSKSRGIGLILKIRLHASWSSTHNARAWEGTKDSYNQ